jgi:hypothetical protein
MAPGTSTKPRSLVTTVTGEPSHRCSFVGICHAAILNRDFFLMIRFYLFGTLDGHSELHYSQSSWRPNEETTSDSVELIVRFPTSRFSTGESTAVTTFRY